MVDEQGIIMFLAFVVIVLLFILLGIGVKPIQHKEKAGKIIEFIGPDGKIHKAQLLPDEKPKKKINPRKYIQ